MAPRHITSPTLHNPNFPSGQQNSSLSASGNYNRSDFKDWAQRYNKKAWLELPDKRAWAKASSAVNQHGSTEINSSVLFSSSPKTDPPLVPSILSSAGAADVISLIPASEIFDQELIRLLPVECLKLPSFWCLLKQYLFCSWVNISLGNTTHALVLTPDVDRICTNLHCSFDVNPIITWTVIGGCQ